MIDYQDNEMLFRFTCLKIPVGYNHLKKQSFFLLFKQCTGTLPKRYFHADSWPIYVNRKSTEYKQLIENLEAHKIDYSIIFINLQFTLPL